MSRVHAIILAAGVGRRLGAVHDHRPKCLLRFDGVSLLQRQLAMLAGAGVERSTVVIGHEAAQVEREFAAAAATFAPDMAVTTLFNPDYRKGSVLSCLAASQAFCSGDTVLLMDGDVLCDGRLLDPLLTSPHDNCVLVDRALPPGDEPVKLAVRGDGHPAGFGKTLSAAVAGDTVGESVGFFRLTAAMAEEFAGRCSRHEQAGDVDTPYEHPLRDLMLARAPVFGYEDITGLPWIEIDFPEDAQRAQRDVLPRLCDMTVVS